MSDTATIAAFGIGIGRRNQAGALLDVWYPAPRVDLSDELAHSIANLPVHDDSISGSDVFPLVEQAKAAGDTDLAASLQALSALDQPLVACVLQADGPIQSTAEAYLKLHLLSHRLRMPNTQNLDGIFAHLPNVAWTSEGPIDPADLPERIFQARTRGENLTVHSVDKFPSMTDYVQPSGVRIADASRVRLGAYLGEGTTVMPYGYVNFNAAALGPNMIEGRVSQGVVIGAGTDLGAGSSTMGTLSGGNEVVISLGEQCLIGANGGAGLPLGDRCTIEAGLYVTGATPVLVRDEDGAEVKRTQARELSGMSDLLFIRNGATGQVECRVNRKAISLNEALHAHN